MFQKLKSAGLTLQLPKFKLGMSSCEFLGHKVGAGKISPQDAKVDAVANFIQPSTKKEGA